MERGSNAVMNTSGRHNPLLHLCVESCTHSLRLCRICKLNLERHAFLHCSLSQTLPYEVMNITRQSKQRSFKICQFAFFPKSTKIFKYICTIGTQIMNRECDKGATHGNIWPLLFTHSDTKTSRHYENLEFVTLREEYSWVPVAL